MERKIHANIYSFIFKNLKDILTVSKLEQSKE
jgi:hypothetical protein